MKQYWYQAWYVLFQQPFSIQICWHNIKQDCYHDVLLEQHCSRLFVHQPWTVLFHACWQLATGCAFFLFLRVLITNSPLRRHHFSDTFSRDPAVQLYHSKIFTAVHKEWGVSPSFRLRTFAWFACAAKALGTRLRSFPQKWRNKLMPWHLQCVTQVWIWSRHIYACGHNQGRARGVLTGLHKNIFRAK